MSWFDFEQKCRHKVENGYNGAPPYLRPSKVIIDGCGREHWQLIGNCRYCGEAFHVANVHGPLKLRKG